MGSEGREILLFWPVVAVIWAGTLIGVAVLAAHAFFKDLPWMNR